MGMSSSSRQVLDQLLVAGGVGGVDAPLLAGAGVGHPQVPGQRQDHGGLFGGVDPQDHDRVGQGTVVVLGLGVGGVAAGAGVGSHDEVVAGTPVDHLVEGHVGALDASQLPRRVARHGGREQGDDGGHGPERQQEPLGPGPPGAAGAAGLVAPSRPLTSVASAEPGTAGLVVGSEGMTGPRYRGRSGPLGRARNHRGPGGGLRSLRTTGRTPVGSRSLDPWRGWCRSRRCARCRSGTSRPPCAARSRGPGPRGRRRCRRGNRTRRRW